MVEEHKARIMKLATGLIEDIDKTHLRKMQANMHLCAANCCQNTTANVDQVQECVNRCTQSFSVAQTFVQNEVDHLQRRLQRCVSDCNDSILDKMGVDKNKTDESYYIKQFEKCAGECVDKYADLIPQSRKKIVQMLDTKLKE